MREVSTTSLISRVGPEKLKHVILAFRALALAEPEEHHFVIRFANEDEGRGLEVWAIIDEYAEEKGGRLMTFLLPEDY